MRTIPKNPVRKAIDDPSSVKNWLKNRVLEERIITPLRARYLFDHEWDIAVILDACRYDLGVEKTKDHAIQLGSPERVYSAASNSADWIRRTFDAASSEVLSMTGYITGNLYTNRLPNSQLGYIDKVWEYGWDTEKGCVPPRPITDRAITAHRQSVADRLVVHYMQPHLPPVKEDPRYKHMRGPPDEGSGANKRGVWERVSDGDLSGSVVKSAYRDNLHPVLDEVSILLNNIDASKVIVTADHGNYLGENGRWGHPGFEIASPVRHVPWWETTAENNGTRTPAEYGIEKHTPSREDQLRALGYK